MVLAVLRDVMGRGDWRSAVEEGLRKIPLAQVLQPEEPTATHLVCPLLLCVFIY